MSALPEKECNKQPTCLTKRPVLDHSWILESCHNYAKNLNFQILEMPYGGKVFYRAATSEQKPVFSILSGLHGEERAGPEFIYRLMKSWSEGHELVPELNLLIVPVANVTGWDQGCRYWENLDLNEHFSLSAESNNPAGLLSQVYQKYLPDIHWDIHEDICDTDPYIWMYKSDLVDPQNARLAEYLGCKTVTWTDLDDGSSESLTKKLGAAWSLTSEIPVDWKMGEKLRWLWSIYSYIQLAADIP